MIRAHDGHLADRATDGNRSALHDVPGVGAGEEFLPTGVQKIETAVESRPNRDHGCLVAEVVHGPLLSVRPRGRAFEAGRSNRCECLHDELGELRGMLVG